MLLTILCLAAGPSRAASPEDFAVPSVPAGSTFQLAAARGSYVALHFLLKTECPICLRHVREFSRRSGELEGVVQVFLKPDSVEDIERWMNSLGDGVPSAPIIYRDAGAALARAYGIPDGYRFHGEIVHYPALILLDPDGKEIFRHVGRNNTDRVSFGQLAEQVAAAKARNAATPSPAPAPAP
ncbi:MAG: redoxin domain-containing protein [Verrucomicrobiae bacterium]|nr:redoxin domain-containing protein [Verrucomicrobiae bacterium]